MKLMNGDLRDYTPIF